MFGWMQHFKFHFLSLLFKRAILRVFAYVQIPGKSDNIVSYIHKVPQCSAPIKPEEEEETFSAEDASLQMLIT